MSILIPLSAIVDNPYQTRLSYDAEHAAAIGESIRANGQLQPALGRVVHENGTPLELDALDLATRSEIMRYVGQGAQVQLAFGHNRARAMRGLGTGLSAEYWKDGRACMNVELRMLDDEQMARMAWSENAQRKDINAVEEARAIERMIGSFGWTHDQVAAELKLARPTVSNKLRLLRLPDEVLEHLAAGRLSESQARALVTVYEAWDKLTEDDHDLIKWYRKAYSLTAAAGQPERILRDALESGRSADAIRKSAINAETLDRYGRWRQDEKERKARQKGTTADKPAKKSKWEIKRERIAAERKAKAAAMEARWTEAMTTHKSDVVHCEAGSLIVLAYVLSSSTKPAVAKTAKTLGIEFEKLNSVEEHFEALGRLHYHDAWRLALGAMMAKEIQANSEWDAPTTFYDAVMAGIETEQAAEARRQSRADGIGGDGAAADVSIGVCPSCNEAASAAMGTELCEDCAEAEEAHAVEDAAQCDTEQPDHVLVQVDAERLIAAPEEWQLGPFIGTAYSDAVYCTNGSAVPHPPPPDPDHAMPKGKPGVRGGLQVAVGMSPEQAEHYREHGHPRRVFVRLRANVNDLRPICEIRRDSDVSAETSAEEVPA